MEKSNIEKLTDAINNSSHPQLIMESLMFMAGAKKREDERKDGKNPNEEAKLVTYINSRLVHLSERQLRLVLSFIQGLHG